MVTDPSGTTGGGTTPLSRDIVAEHLIRIASPCRGSTPRTKVITKACGTSQVGCRKDAYAVAMTLLSSRLADFESEHAEDLETLRDAYAGIVCLADDEWRRYLRG